MACEMRQEAVEAVKEARDASTTDCRPTPPAPITHAALTDRRERQLQPQGLSVVAVMVRPQLDNTLPPAGAGPGHPAGAAPSQRRAAARLDLPVGTYRRHLREGERRVAERLWQRELGAGP